MRAMILRNGITRDIWPVVETTGNGEKPFKGLVLQRDHLTVVETTAYCEKPLKGFGLQHVFFARYKLRMSINS